MKKLWLAVLLLTASAWAHVGSPDVFFEGDAGPYHLLMTVRPPAMIPGVAQVEVRVTSGDVSGIQVVPVYYTGKDQGLPPSPDVMRAVPGESGSYVGQVWLMASGSWEVRAEVSGAQGTGKLVVPVAAYARRTLPMQKALGALLFGLMLFLAVGVVAISGAATREGLLDPGVTPSSSNRRWGRVAMVVSAIMVVALLWLGNWWWNSEAADLKRNMLYQAPPLNASLEGSDRLVLKMGTDFWHERRREQWSMDLIPDHGHLMHLFLLRTPAMDRFYHLHPEQTSDGGFALNLPAVDAGHYKIFADVVRGSGFPDTMVGEIYLPQISGGALSGDDSEASAPAFAGSSTTTASLPDGGKMIWEHGPAAPGIGKLTWFRFRVADKNGKPVTDLQPYMGMAGHAEFVRSDQQVFAHVHPAGSVPMAALQIVEKDAGTPEGMQHAMALPAEISFPYGFPQPGDYRLFVQVKHGGVVETGVFDTTVQ